MYKIRRALPDVQESQAVEMAILAVLLSVHVLLLGGIAVSWSPNCDETGHLAGGLVIWEYGDFSLYCANPPLTRLLAHCRLF